MKGYRVGKNKVIYIYENVITEDEKKVIIEYYLPAGYLIEKRTKDTEIIKERSERNSFNSPAAKATKAELIAWIKEKHPKEAKAWSKKFSPATAGGLGFQKAKAEFKKTFPNYPQD